MQGGAGTGEIVAGASHREAGGSDHSEGEG